MLAKEIAELTGAQLIGDGNKEITGVETLESAGPSDLSFFSNSRYESAMRTSKAGVIFAPKDADLPLDGTFLLTEDPSRDFQKIAMEFCPERPTGFEGIHPTAIVHPTAKIGADVTLAPYAVIDARAEIGAGSTIGPHAVVGPDCKLGEKCHLHAHAIVREGSQLDRGVTLQPGAIVGSCGFGYIADDKGGIQKLDQRGTVHLESGVEIGANATIDRARFKETRIGSHTKIDNLVQIAHNVQIGQSNFIAAQTGIAGSTQTGPGCIFGGQSAAIGHLSIAAGTRLAARGALSKSVPEPHQTFGGAPAAPIHEHHRENAHVRRLAAYAKRISALEKELEALKATSQEYLQEES